MARAEETNKNNKQTRLHDVKYERYILRKDFVLFVMSGEIVLVLSIAPIKTLWCPHGVELTPYVETQRSVIPTILLLYSKYNPLGASSSHSAHWITSDMLHHIFMAILQGYGIRPKLKVQVCHCNVLKVLITVLGVSDKCSFPSYEHN